MYFNISTYMLKATRILYRKDYRGILFRASFQVRKKKTEENKNSSCKLVHLSIICLATVA